MFRVCTTVNQLLSQSVFIGLRDLGKNLESRWEKSRDLSRERIHRSDSKVNTAV